MRRLRRGHVEAVVEAVLEALQDAALVLERVTRREMQLPRHDPHDHAGVSERATSSRAAEARALEAGRTWNPMMMAFEALASSTSESVIAPTPRCTTSTLTSGVESCARASASASAGPP